MGAEGSQTGDPQKTMSNPWWGQWEARLGTPKKNVKALVGAVGSQAGDLQKQCEILGGGNGKPGWGPPKKCKGLHSHINVRRLEALVGFHIFPNLGGWGGAFHFI